MSQFERRMIDVNAARELRVLVIHSRRSLSPQAHARLIALADLVHHEVCVMSRSLDDVMVAATHVDKPPRAFGATRVVDLPDEQTPAQRISAMDLRAESSGWLDRMLRRLGW